MTSIKNISPREINSDLLRNPIASACSSCSPENPIVTPGGAEYLAVAACTLANTSLGLKPPNTLEDIVTTRFRFFLFIEPIVLPYSIFTIDAIGTWRI